VVVDGDLFIQAMRVNGSAALDCCGVACGRLDGYVECTGICCWDVCAGSVIVEEAGGVAVDPYYPEVT